MTPEKALQRIKKCLALAQSSEPNEAAAAIRQAQLLMEKYGLDQSSVEISEITEVKLKSTGSKAQPWESMMSSAIATALGITALLRNGEWLGEFYVKRSQRSDRKPHSRNIYGKATVMFIGTETKVRVAQYMYQTLARQLRKARSELGVRLNAGDALAFNSAWVMAVAPKIRAFAQPFDERINRYIESKFDSVGQHEISDKQLETIKSRRNAASLGYSYGKEAQIHNAMETGGNGTLAIAG